MVGPKRNHSILPESFQPHCPQDFDVRSSHMYEIGKNDFHGWDSDEIQIGSQGKQYCGSMIFFNSVLPIIRTRTIRLSS